MRTMKPSDDDKPDDLDYVVAYRVMKRTREAATTLVEEASQRLAEIGEAQGCEAVASRRFYEGRLSALDDLGLSGS